MVNIPTILGEKIAGNVHVNQWLYHVMQHVWLYHFYNNWLNFKFFWGFSLWIINVYYKFK